MKGTLRCHISSNLWRNWRLKVSCMGSIWQPQQKLWTPMAWMSVSIDNILHIVTHGCAESVRHPEDNKSFTFGTFPDLAQCVFPFGWLWLPSFCYSKTEIKYSVSCILWISLASLSEEWETLNLKCSKTVSELFKNESGQEIPELAAVQYLRWGNTVPLGLNMTMYFIGYIF